MQALIVRNSQNTKAIDASVTLAAYFSTQGIGFDMVGSDELYGNTTATFDRAKRSADLDLVVSLGGDGTLLRAARLIRGLDVPILGINFGNLGFLANSCEDGVVPIVASALVGELKAERRANLQINIVCEGECAEGNSSLWRETQSRGSEDAENSDELGDQQNRQFFALNEIAIARGALGRMLNFSLDISDNHISDISGDGIVIASATGSTAYALAAGGPLVAPSFSGLIAQPIAPHTLTARTILTDPSDVVCVSFPEGEGYRHPALFIDGDIIDPGKPVSEVYVRRGTEYTTLLYTTSSHFYDYASKTFFNQ